MFLRHITFVLWSEFTWFSLSENQAKTTTSPDPQRKRLTITHAVLNWNVTRHDVDAKFTCEARHKRLKSDLSPTDFVVLDVECKLLLWVPRLSAQSYIHGHRVGRGGGG